MEKDKKEKIKRIIENEIHKNLYVVDKGTKQYPDYVVGGTNELVSVLLTLFEFVDDGKQL